MTYLGYQVAHEPDCSEELAAWFERHNGKHFWVWGKTVVGSGSDYGTDPEEYPWKDASPIACFEDQGDRCEFTTINEYFVIDVVDLPCDRWGNTATFATGINLVAGCFEVAYSDNSCIEYADELEKVLERLDAEIDTYDFIEWVQENHRELVDEITEEMTCNGTAGGWEYITTNKSFDSPEWLQAATEYLES